MREAFEGEGVVETGLVFGLVAELSEPCFGAIEDPWVAAVVDLVETVVETVVETMVETMVSVLGSWDEDVAEILVEDDGSEDMIGPSLPPEAPVVGERLSSANMAALI